MAEKSTSHVGVEDTLSQFPDDVLVHILSFLPTLYSVRTMVLSKRWNNLWTSVPTLDFDLQDIGQGDFDSFATFVERALSLHKSPSTIRKFRLHFVRYDIYLSDKIIARIRNWISTAVSSHELGEVDILLVAYNCERLELKLPRRLFLCKTLEVLRVESNFITYHPTKPGYFPSLKFAEVTAKYVGHSSMRQLFCYCPLLEELFIEATTGIDEEDFELNVSAPELKTLRTRFCARGGTGSIYIDAPKLENLLVTDTTDGWTNYYLTNANSLVEAKIDRFYNYYQTYPPSYFHHAPALLAGVSGVKYLSISGSDLLKCPLPTFNNLKQLKLLLVRCSYWGYVMELLKQSPTLEDLVLDINVRSRYYEIYGFDPFTPPEMVPVCVVSHLKTISITNFMRHDHELDLVKYLFKYGEVLNKITISTSSPLHSETRLLTEWKLLGRLLKYQKSSKSCEVEVKFHTKGVGSSTCSNCGSSHFYEEEASRGTLQDFGEVNIIASLVAMHCHRYVEAAVQTSDAHRGC